MKQTQIPDGLAAMVSRNHNEVQRALKELEVDGRMAEDLSEAEQRDAHRTYEAIRATYELLVQNYSEKPEEAEKVPMY